MPTSATTSRKERTFRSAPYLEQLLAELDRAAISRRIAQAREEAGLTQPELAAGIINPDTGDPYTWRAVQTWERGQKNKKKEHKWVVPFDHLGEIAEITGTSRGWLLHGDDAEFRRESRVEAQADRLADAIEELIAVLRRLDARLAG